MKKVITMVGTSLFENFLKTCENETLHNCYEELKEKRASEWENELSRIKKLEKGITKWIKNLAEEEKIKISAEIKSLYNLKKELKDEFEIYLLTSDTILSKFANEIIKELIEELEIGKIFCNGVSGLQIWDRDEFKEGMSNLINKLYEIAGGYWDNVIINITGGFKATIPFLTILAQLNGCPIYYIFEDTDALIKISTPLALVNLPTKRTSYFLTVDQLDKLGTGTALEITTLFLFRFGSHSIKAPCTCLLTQIIL